MELEIIEIYPNHLYSVKYSNQQENEFDRLFFEWNQMDKVVDFLDKNKIFLANPIWGEEMNIEDAAKKVKTEAEILEDKFDELAENTGNGHKPDFDSHFTYLGGKYIYELTSPPMKSYGPIKPSMLRIYAIKLSSNLYIVTGGGIKLSDTIQNSPGLKEHVIQNIDAVRDYLKTNGIQNIEDLT